MRPQPRRVLLVFLGSLACLTASPSRAGGTPTEGGQAEMYRVIQAALQLRDVPLRVHPTCAKAAPLLPARTIGDYLGGFLAAMGDGQNRVSARCKPGPGLPRCELWLKHADEEDEWAWGIAFQLDARGRPRPSSVQCLGTG